MGKSFNMRMIVIVGLFLCLCFWQSTSEALTLTTFDACASVDLRYQDRVCLSTDLLDEDFRSVDSSDYDGNGVVDILEQDTFYVEGTHATVYVGNQHNRYAMNNVLIAIGIDGDVDSFTINNCVVTTDNMIDAGDSAVFWADERVKDYVDFVTLISLDTRLGDRDPNGSALGDNDVYEMTLSNVVWQGSGVPRVYCTAYGVLASGVVNSYSPYDSDLLFVPTREIDTNPAAPVPEPTMLGLVACGLFLITMKKGERND